MRAPASNERRASAAISAGVNGTAGLWSRVVSAPHGATVMTSSSLMQSRDRFCNLRPRPHALERGGDAKDRHVLVGPPGDLDTRWDTLDGRARRHREHRAAAAHVEDRGQEHVVELDIEAIVAGSQL